MYIVQCTWIEAKNENKERFKSSIEESKHRKQQSIVTFCDSTRFVPFFEMENEGRVKLSRLNLEIA